MTDINRLDAVHKHQAYTGLAHHYAKTDNVWLALHAQTIADLAAVELVLLDVGAPSETVMAAIQGSLADQGDQIDQASEASAALNLIRDCIAANLPDDLVAPWLDRISESDYLAGSKVAAEQTEQLVLARFGGEEASAFIANRYAEASRESARIAELHDANESWEAVLAGYTSDLAVFEAWIFERSLRINDLTFAQAEMRWALAVAALEAVTELPDDVENSRFLVRSRLAWTLGPQDAAAFARVVSRY